MASVVPLDLNPGDEEIRRRAKLLQQLIPNFGRNYEEGMKKFREGQLASAAKPLRQAHGYYQQQPTWHAVLLDASHHGATAHPLQFFARF